MSAFQSAMVSGRRRTISRSAHLGRRHDSPAGRKARPPPANMKSRSELAKAAKLGSAAVAGGAQAIVGAGTLTVSMGSVAFGVTLAADSTLADLRDAINEATGNPGVQATLITDIEGTHLVMSGGKTGAANAMRVTAAGGNPALNAFVFDPPGTTAVNVGTARTRAWSVGYEIPMPTTILRMRSTRTLSEKAEVGEVVSLSIKTDEAGIRSRVNEFIKAYNGLSTQIAKLRSYDAETKVAGPLLGDAMLRNLETQMRRIISDPVSSATGAYNSLAALGITSSVSGTLTLDETRFNAAMATDRAAVSRVFASEQGVAVRMDGFVKDRLSESSELATRDARILTRRKDIAKQKESLETRMEIIQARYQRQFSALDSMLTSASTSAYLGQQLSAAAAK